MKATIASLLLLLAIGYSVPASAQESKYKALFIYKFADLIKWPSGNTNVIIGVAGKSDVLEELKKVAAIRGNLTILSLNSAADATKCQIVYVPIEQRKSTAEFHKNIGTNSILLVTDEINSVSSQSDIGFFLENEQLRFAVSEKMIQSKHMIVSPKLIALGQTKEN